MEISDEHAEEIAALHEHIAAVLKRCRPYVEAYVTNTDAPEGVTGGLKLLQELNALLGGDEPKRA